MADDIRSPAELRAMFGSNLRHLARDYPSVSALCRKLGINRTQFNRYLAGESFPRPDVLDRICRFFDVDARIVLSPLGEIPAVTEHPASSILTQFLGSGSEVRGPKNFASGFYAVAESQPSAPQVTLLYAKRRPQCTLIRGYTPRAHMPGTSPQAREIQGIAATTGDHVYILTSQRGGHNSKIYLLNQDAEIWRGTVIKPSEPHQPKPVVLRHLKQNAETVFQAARRSAKTGGPSV
ncbi:MAG: helix-turn-helix transcriptional regulator [Pseudomonadota bacterium]